MNTLKVKIEQSTAEMRRSRRARIISRAGEKGPVPEGVHT